MHHTYTCTHSLSNSLYVNKVPLKFLCSPSCFHPICPQSVVLSPSTNTNTHWHDQEQQQCVNVHLMYSWGGRVWTLFALLKGKKIKQGNIGNVVKFLMQLCKGPHSSQDFCVTLWVLTALSVMGYVMKRSTISFVNLFSPFPFFSQTHCWNSPVISTTVRTSFHAWAAVWQVGDVQAAKGPAAHHMDQMKADSERLRRYGLLMEDWLVTMCVVEVYNERKGYRHAFWGAFWGAPVCLEATETYRAALLNLKVKKAGKKGQKNNTGQKFYLPIFACTLLFLSYFFSRFPIKVSVCNNKTAYSLKSCLSEFHWLTRESPHWGFWRHWGRERK